jgi:hypothetical protein
VVAIVAVVVVRHRRQHRRWSGEAAPGPGLPADQEPSGR